MKSKLQNQLQSLNQETDKIYSLIEGLSEEQLHDQSYGWSIVQVMGHLNLSEGGSVIYMKKKMQAGEKMENAGARNWLRLNLTRGFMQSRLKWKVPKKVAGVIANPDNSVSFDDMKKNWEKTRISIKDYIDEYPEQYLSKAVYKHPFAGRQTLKGALDTFITHQRHHIHQIKRIINEIRA